MNMLILSLHIAIAMIMTGATLGVFAAAYTRRETKAYITMIVSFAGTVGSGVALLFVSAGGIGRFCAMMTAFTLTVFVARSYYRARVVMKTSL